MQKADTNTSAINQQIRIIKGKLYKYRTWLSYALLVLLFTGPIIKINGEQLVLLNILERKFVFFGVIFYPQDFHLFVFASLTLLIFILLFTLVFGRVWCGWACPQTIFMEMFFRKIEIFIEGNASKQKELRREGRENEILLRKGLKHLIFVILSFLIANTFLAYIIGSEEVLKIAREPISLHIVGFIAIFLFTAIFYIVFAYVREVVCTVICPYGRLQGVLLDNKSLVVAYDYLRGEPRGKKKRDQIDELKGDCIDCDLCVQVCPTKIDIRNGTQLECINCTACIDACNTVMNKLGLPENLIGFKSETSIKTRERFHFGKRIYSYAGILTVLAGALIFLLADRSDIEATVLRAAGTLYQERENGAVSNLYNAELINKTARTISFDLKPEADDYRIEFINKKSIIKKGESLKLTFFIIKEKGKLENYKTPIKLNLIENKDKALDKIETTFIAPSTN
jgi:cytochrome c oxidase accessory protein FixG